MKKKIIFLIIKLIVKLFLIPMQNLKQLYQMSCQVLNDKISSNEEENEEKDNHKSENDSNDILNDIFVLHYHNC